MRCAVFARSHAHAHSEVEKSMIGFYFNFFSSPARLHHNVIKTGVRMINLSYSKISLDDVAAKLQLDSPEEAEYIVAKVRGTSS